MANQNGSKLFGKVLDAAGVDSFRLPCNVNWFAVAPIDSGVTATYDIDFFGETVTITDLPFTSPENDALDKGDAPTMTITATVGKVNLIYRVP